MTYINYVYNSVDFDRSEINEPYYRPTDVTDKIHCYSDGDQMV